MAPRAVRRPRIPGIQGRRPGVLALLAAAVAALRHSWIHPNTVLFLSIPGTTNDPEPKKQEMPSTVSVFQSLDSPEGLQVGAIVDAKVKLNRKASGTHIVTLDSAYNGTMKLKAPDEILTLESKSKFAKGSDLRVRVKSVDMNTSRVVVEIEEAILKQWQDERKPPSAYENGTVVDASVVGILKGAVFVDIGCQESLRAKASARLLKMVRWNDTFTDVGILVDSESGTLKAVLPDAAIAILETRDKERKEMNQKEKEERKLKEEADRVEAEWAEKQKKKAERKKNQKERKKIRKQQNEKIQREKEENDKNDMEVEAATMPLFARAPNKDRADFVLSYPDAPVGSGKFTVGFKGLSLDAMDTAKGVISFTYEQKAKGKKSGRTAGKKDVRSLKEIYKGLSEGDMINGRVKVKNRAGIWISVEGYNTNRDLRLKVAAGMKDKFVYGEELRDMRVTTLSDDKSEVEMSDESLKEIDAREPPELKDLNSIEVGHVFEEGYVSNVQGTVSKIDVGFNWFVNLPSPSNLGKKFTDLTVYKVKPRENTTNVVWVSTKKTP